MKWETSNGYIIQRLLTSNLPLLIRGKGKNILIDTCRKKAWNSYSKKLDKVLDGEMIDAVILTHEHQDHTQTINEVVNKYDSYVLVYESVIDEIPVDKKGNLLPVYDKYNLKELGIDGEIIHVPGHSGGSVAIIIDDVVMIGDTVGDFITKPYAKRQKVASIECVKSTEKLLQLRSKLYFPSHKKRVYTFEEYQDYYTRYINGEIIREF